MLTLTHTPDRFTVSCSCDCFHLTFRDRTAVDGRTARCPVCGARAPLRALIRAWHDKRLVHAAARRYG